MERLEHVPVSKIKRKEIQVTRGKWLWQQQIGIREKRQMNDKKHVEA